MQTTVTTLLRDFPRVRKAAFAGERVVVKTREGNLVITAEAPEGADLFGCMMGRIEVHGDLTAPTTRPDEWAL